MQHPGTGSSEKRLQATQVARLLDEAYGRRPWTGRTDPVESLIGTILSQHTSDSNATRAFASLRLALPEWQQVADAPTARVAEAIHTGGLSNVKATRIQMVLQKIACRGSGFDLAFLAEMKPPDARRWLTALPGVGPKTASCVLLFALGKPVMPVDTHVHRVSRRIGLVPDGLSADSAHEAIEAQLPPDRDLLHSFHLNLIQHGRTICTARQPKCGQCILSGLCEFRKALNGQHAGHA